MWVGVCNIHSKRISAIRIGTNTWKISLINVYMLYEDKTEPNNEDYVGLLSLLEELVDNNSDCHVALGGDFKVDFSRNWLHTA
jgi:hypothetical protein